MNKFTQNSLLLENLVKQNKLALWKVISFNQLSNKWEYNPIETAQMFSTSKLTVMTYNIWFDETNMKDRLNALLDMFSYYSPEVICLQEVIDYSYNFFINSSFIQKNYYVSLNYQKGYYVMIMSKIPPVLYSMEFPSQMGRNLLIAEFISNSGSSVLIATSHFESLSNAKLRKTQLDSSFDLLRNSEISLLMGDFNLDGSENNVLPKDYVDSYVKFCSLGNNLLHYTMPKTEEFSEWRPDRIMFKGNIELRNFQVIGTQSIDVEGKLPKGCVKTPSDHYGLFAEYNLC